MNVITSFAPKPTHVPETVRLSFARSLTVLENARSFEDRVSHANEILLLLHYAQHLAIIDAVQASALRRSLRSTLQVDLGAIDVGSDFDIYSVLAVDASLSSRD